MSEADSSSYAITMANSSHHWYKVAAIRSRRLHRSSEILVILTSASIPIVALTSQTNAIAPALLGSVIVIVSGVRSLFHWQENYVRFSRAREAVEAERRRYYSRTSPYNKDDERDSILVENVTRIEQEEMGQWIEVAVADRGTKRDT